MGILDAPAVGQQQVSLRTAPANLELESTTQRTISTTATAAIFGNRLRRKVIVQCPDTNTAGVLVAQATNIDSYSAPDFTGAETVAPGKQIFIARPNPIWVKSVSGSQVVVIRQESGSY